jgi:hypothetical protein
MKYIFDEPDKTKPAGFFYWLCVWVVAIAILAIVGFAVVTWILTIKMVYGL